jgi:hypothetical protein
MKAKDLAEKLLCYGQIDTEDYIVETYDPDEETWVPVTKVLFDFDYARIRLYTDSDDSLVTELHNKIKQLSDVERAELLELLQKPASG